MQNKPLNTFSESDSGRNLRIAPDEQPVLRIVGVLLIVTLPLIAIGARLVRVQTDLTDDIVAEFEKTTESFEVIPSRDGRILGADGQVLAHDIRRFHIKVHYRWLEEPADESWVRRQALKDLSRKARRDTELVERRIQEFLDQRDRFWQRLTELNRLDPLEVTYRRSQVQKRIERILESVERRRKERRVERLQSLEHAGDGESEWWRKAWKQVRHELTTSPERSGDEPIVIQEELDYHRLLTEVSFDVAMHIETHPELFPGASIERATERHYPLADLAAHAVGVRTPLRSDELQELSEDVQGELKSGDRIGRSGIEKQYDKVLRGRPGLRRIERNRAGEIVETEVVREPETGKDVYVALNLELQRSTESLLDEKIAQTESTLNAHAGASAVVVDVRTGDVVTLANAPRYDLNLMLHADPVQWKSIVDDQRQPLFPRATRMALPPGSVFKTISSLAVLHSGVIDPDEPFFCQGYLHNPSRYRCYTFRHYGHGHGDLKLLDAITRSCNVYFYHAAEQIGPQPFIDWAGRIGIGTRTGIDLPGEGRGNLPTPDQKDREGRQLAWYKGDSLGLAIGQSRLTTTPLQIARAMAALANGGYLVTPRVVSRSTVGQPTMTSLDDRAESVPKRPIEMVDVELLDRIREGMERVVNHPSGTGYKSVRLSDVKIAGKTGTAEVGGGRSDHAWFAGYVPADEPRYAFAIVIEHGGSGGRTAGPVARAVVERMIELEMLPRTGQLSSGRLAN